MCTRSDYIHAIVTTSRPTYTSIIYRVVCIEFNVDHNNNDSHCLKLRAKSAYYSPIFAYYSPIFEIQSWYIIYILYIVIQPWYMTYIVIQYYILHRGAKSSFNSVGRTVQDVDRINMGTGFVIIFLVRHIVMMERVCSLGDHPEQVACIERKRIYTPFMT